MMQTIQGDGLVFLAPSNGVKITIQILCTTLLLYAVYLSYFIVEPIMDGMTPASQNEGRFDEQSTPVALLGVFVMLVCGVYVFMTLKNTKLKYFDDGGPNTIEYHNEQ